MSFNSSSFSNSSLHSAAAVCFNFRVSFYIFTAFSTTNILILLPLCILVIHQGIERWRKHAKTSNSDIFTYHIVAMEMVGVVGCGFYCGGAGFNVSVLMKVGVYFFSVTSNGQIFFHILTCVERYLAVVHPVTYLGLNFLKKEGGMVKKLKIVLNIRCIKGKIVVQDMSVNSSSSISFFYFMHNCFTSTVGAFSMTAFTITSILLLLPVYIFVLYLGHQRWQQQRSKMTMSHSDLFTFHMVVIELMSVLGSIFSCCGIFAELPQIIMLGIFLVCINLSGQIFFHTLTCMERYLAVVHPVTYLSLKQANGIRLRNITIICVWLISFGLTGFVYVASQISMLIVSICVISLVLFVTSFCSLSVLCVLVSPGPGERVVDRRKVDQSKLRAFYTILAILGVLLLRFGGYIFAIVAYVSDQLEENAKCGMWTSMIWLSLPSSLVLPLLFLQRAGKLLCCKNNESGQGPA
ncbi:hypothetical protein L3Q82_003894 [Scortum barcoo]|uniref:Uncharacterized protein n=1 Tax=Scortum barcoo TaxID=214431 RepID=A0ACB8X620_9TELE|nr:hypothetical protein L3Q82_003894 [Scortum barcoo]